MPVVDYVVSRLAESRVTALDAGTLRYDPEEIRKLVLEDERIATVEVVAVNPGDDTRLVQVLDSVTPVCKADGSPGVFPGVLCPTDLTNDHATHRLLGVVVTVLGALPSDDSFFAQHEAILDFRSGRDHSPLAHVSHLALSVTFEPSVVRADRPAAVRHLSATVAERLARTTLTGDAKGDVLPSGDNRDGQQRLVHICEVTSFGYLIDTRILETPAAGMLPVLVSEQQLVDGWVMSSDYHYSGQRNPTCVYQNNPVAEAVRGRSDEAALAGIILLPISTSDGGKRRNATVAATIAQTLGADGGIVTAVAGGNTHLDVMFTVRALESRGIPAALVLVEMANPDGSDPGMVDTVPEADLIVSTGNREAPVTLDPVSLLLGTEHIPAEGELILASAAHERPLTTPLRTILCSNNEIGMWRIGAIAG